MNEFMRENEVIGEVRAPLEHAAPDIEPKKETTPVNRMERLFEKRELLKEKHAKSIENEKSAANRTKVIDKIIEAQMAKVNKEIHADEVSRMDRFCAERNFTYDDIMDILGVFPKEATAADIKAMYK